MTHLPGCRLARTVRRHVPRLGLALTVLAAGAAGANPPPPAANNNRPLVVTAAVAPAVPAAVSPLDAPLRLIAEARQSYQQVRDYTCLLIKRENVNGQLMPENLIAMKVRNQPFSVYLRWLAPKASVGQEACYVVGRNNGMMRVHPAGLRGAIGFVSIDPRDPRALQASRHSITEAGIGNLIERYGQRWEMERSLNRTQVRVADYEFNKRPCTRVELVHPDRTVGQLYAYRTVMYFDKETRLPVRVESYDWPRAGGPLEGDLMECFSYVDMRFNVGLTDEAFRY